MEDLMKRLDLKHELQDITTTTTETRGLLATASREETKPELSFREISYKLAIETVVREHYLHRRCPVSYPFGAYANAELVGVLTVGCSASWSVRAGLVGETYKTYKNNPTSRANDVFELNRLWMRDDLPDNSESQFIGWCLRWLRKLKPAMILVSYADGEMGHVGWVYQGTNFLYTGTSARFKDIHPEGFGDCRKVPMSMRGEKVGNKRAWAADPTIPRRERSAKHRYVWFARPADRSILAWPVLPYPTKPAEHNKESSMGNVTTEDAPAPRL
jgi:hypothetical protein